MPACSVLKAGGTEVENKFLKGLATINIEHNAHGHWLINIDVCYMVSWAHLESMTYLSCANLVKGVYKISFIPSPK